MEPSGDITRLLADIRSGAPHASEKLIELVYAQLRKLAAACMRRERPDHSLQPTALVHEVYLRLVDQRDRNWENRAHFFGVAAHLMRLILIDHARRHRAQKHGGGKAKIPIDKVNLFSEEQFDNLIALDEALNRLADKDKRMARVVELRFFGDLGFDEIAEALGVSARTAKRDWNFARPWLSKELGADVESDG